MENVTVPRFLLKMLGKNIYDTYQTYGWWARYDDDDEWISANMVAEDIGGFWVKFVQFMPELAEEIEKEFEQEEHDE